MEKGFNLTTRETFDKIVNDINDSGLPITMSKYIVRDILKQIEDVEQRQIIKEQEEYNQHLQEEEKKKEKKENG